MAENALRPDGQSDRRPLAPAAEAAEGATAVPRVDVLETEDELLILADLPGVRPEDVDVRFEDGELLLHGRRQPGHADKRRVLWEYEAPGYARSFRVTEKVDASRIHADLKNGVLTVHLPKVEAARPRRITVRSE
jgi:HSP20 family protein